MTQNKGKALVILAGIAGLSSRILSVKKGWGGRDTGTK